MEMGAPTNKSLLGCGHVTTSKRLGTWGNLLHEPTIIVGFIEVDWQSMFNEYTPSRYDIANSQILEML